MSSALGRLLGEVTVIQVAGHRRTHVALWGEIWIFTGSEDVVHLWLLSTAGAAGYSPIDSKFEWHLNGISHMGQKLFFESIDSLQPLVRLHIIGVKLTELGALDLKFQ